MTSAVSRPATRALGSTGLRLPIVGMGTRYTFDVSGKAAQAACRAAVTTALAHGVELFDTSPLFDESERVLGTTLTARRERAFVATGAWAWETRDGLQQIARALHLFDGRLDLVQALSAVNWAGYVAPFQHMRTVGEARAIGVSAEHPRDLPDLLAAMRSGAFDTVQIPLHPLFRTFAAQVVPLAAELGMGILISQPFGSGSLLTRQPAMQDLRRFRAFGCQTWAQVLLKWILSDPRISVVLPASSDPAHIAQNAAAGRPPWFGPDERRAVLHLAERAAGN